MSALSLMIQGTASSVGKSLLVAALCRIYRRRGLAVCPFKSQNMALNSFVTPDGKEIGRAQAVQAEAAGILPEADMNPILLKPTTDRKSQVILRGEVVDTLDARQYYACRSRFRETVAASYRALAGRFDLICIEGAGSPAEINLRENDLANMGMAELADAPVVLVGDIDRGGVFASLFGTVSLLQPQERARIKAMIVNKFRGDSAILEPGLREMQAKLGIPFLGVLPYQRFLIDEEDSLSERYAAPGKTDAALRVGVIRLPRMANSSDFTVFDSLTGVSLTYIDEHGHWPDPHLVILPGSKSTIADLDWLRASGLAARIASHVAKGGALVGICGGFQMLGHAIHDLDGVDGTPGSATGLGLLDVDTVFAPRKQTVQASGQILATTGPLQRSAGMQVAGYEVHMGSSSHGDRALPLLRMNDGSLAGACREDGRIWGTYLHGIFDNLEFTRSFLTALCKSSALPEPDEGASDYDALREAEYDRLADMVAANLDMDALDAIIGL